MARLRAQIESTANLGGDASLFGPEGIGVVQGLTQAIMVLLGKPLGFGITPEEVAQIAAWESQLARLYVKAMQRLLAEPLTP